MVSFESDYNTGACPEILSRFMETNLEPCAGYGSDHYTLSAIDKIREAIECPDAQIYLATGGTQTNQLVISTVLDDTEGVVAVKTGHVATHEAGAIEHSGHKVLALPEHQGKMDVNELRDYLYAFFNDGNRDHCVFPGMVYITQPTEYGSLYSKAELEAIHNVCLEYELPLYIDGARLGYGLASDECDMTFADVARLCEVFYIGGTKVGALCGEAIVFTKNNQPKRFLTLAKQRGALMAKGKVLGLQFDTLFTNDLYINNGRHAIGMKNKMLDVLKKHNLEFFYESPTNQQFIILENTKLEELSKSVAVTIWEPYDDNHTVVRLVTSWSTTDEDISKLDEALGKLA